LSPLLTKIELLPALACYEKIFRPFVAVYETSLTFVGDTAGQKLIASFLHAALETDQGNR
jgi:hypothetical protein